MSPAAVSPSVSDDLDLAIVRAATTLRREQRGDGHPEFFPPWALARYRSPKHSDSLTAMVGL